MKGWWVGIALVCLLGCESVTMGPAPQWGTINGVPFAPEDVFFLPSAQANGDYDFVLIAADRLGYCSILQQNLAGYPANLTYATVTLSNSIGTGSVNPAPGIYPVTDAYGANASAQVSYGTVTNCVVSPVLTADAGAVVMTFLADDLSGMAGTFDAGFGTAGTLSGTFNAPVCDTSNAVQGASQCYQ